MAVWIKNQKMSEKSIDALIAFFHKNNFTMERPLAYAAANRGVDRPSAAVKYVKKSLSDLYDIRELKNVTKSFAIIKSALVSQKKICIYGDYDVDGVMSTTILYKGLSRLGANVAYYIPDRITDGYGLNKAAIENIAQRGCDLLITCDNGISALEEIDFAAEQGITTVILDHHEPPVEEMEDGSTEERLPNADAVVDAKISDSGYGFNALCAGGLCYKFILGLYDFLGERCNDSTEYLILASVATVCDVVPLKEENRIIVHNGLRAINSGECKNVGLNALVNVLALQAEGRLVTETDYGFIIGPCINASGRLELAAQAVELFITEKEDRALKIAQKLLWLNTERKKMTEEGVKKVNEKIQDFCGDRVIVSYIEGIHESVVGIIAGRIKEIYNKPAIVLTESKGVAKGSARSIEEYNMFKGLTGCRSVLLRFGGHAMAAGLSLEKENVPKLRKMLNEKCSLTEEDLTKKYIYDGELSFDHINIASVEQLDVLRPYGANNEAPLYVTNDVLLYDLRVMGVNKNAVSFMAADTNKDLRCIAFGDKMVEYICDVFGGRHSFRGDIIYAPSINEYRGCKNVQLKIIDIRQQN